MNKMTFDIDLHKERWNREYLEFQIIPSSVRPLPSKPLLLYSELLNLRSPGRVLDAGCGNGRNSIYLAQLGWTVDSVDFSPAALSRLRQDSLDQTAAERIRLHEIALIPPFPFEDNSFDLALDSYVLCHFDDPVFKADYRDELLRVIRPGGFLFSSLFSVEDEYYQKVGQLVDAQRRTVRDPNNCIVKQLYTPQEARSFFAEKFSVRYLATFEFEDVVIGTKYVRSILAIVLEKRPD
jgi:SAM-dependent methyltransferase